MPKSRLESNKARASAARISRKRDRYVLHACNRCRAAKVRCDGGLPCAYCVARNPNACDYSTPRLPEFLTEAVLNGAPRGQMDNDEFQRSISTLLQQQTDKLDTLLERIEELGTVQNCSIPSRSSIVERVSPMAEQPLPLFRGSTSALFYIGVIDTNLKALEIPAAPPSPREDNRRRTSFSIIQGQIVDDMSGDATEEEPEDVSFSPLGDLGRKDGQIDSIQPLGLTDVMRLVHEYEDRVGGMYPILDIAYLLQQAPELWAVANGGALDNNRIAQIDQKDVAILKLVVAITLVLEGESHYELALGLLNSVLPEVQAMIWNAKVNLKGLVLLTLVALFYFYSNKWRLSWRFLGNIARIILELGLNRRLVLDHFFPNQIEHAQAINTIWTVYVLNHQLIYSLGLSEAIQDLLLDEDFPRPIEAPYLEAMIRYARIGQQSCDTLLGDRHRSLLGANNRQEMFSFFQYRLEEWRKSITTDFQFSHNDKKTDKWNHQLRTILYLRANHLGIIIARSFLSGNETIGAGPSEVWTYSVDMAADTIRILTCLDSSPAMHCLNKLQTNYFLITALGILLLAISQGPYNHTPGSLCQNHPSMPAITYLKAQHTAIAALNMLYRQAESSSQSQRLWERVRGLTCRLNLLDYLIPVDDRLGNSDHGERATTGVILHAIEPVKGHTVPTETGTLTAILPAVLDANISDSMGLGELSTPDFDISPTLSSMFDPSFFADT